LATQNEPSDTWQGLVDLYAEPMEDIARRGDFEAQLRSIDILNQRIRMPKPPVGPVSELN
jgi:hypothetical protein